MSYRLHDIHTALPRCKHENDPFQCQRMRGHTGDHGDPWPTTTWHNEADDPHPRGEPCDCEGECYWEGWGTARGHRGPVGPVGIPCEHEYTCTKCGMLHP